jgi:hypothetical protein
MVGVGLVSFVCMLLTMRSLAMPGMALEPEEVAAPRTSE